MAQGNICEGIELEKYIKISANSIGELRKSDVYRVIDSLRSDNLDGVTRSDLATFILENRTDLAAEVTQVMLEEFPEDGWIPDVGADRKLLRINVRQVVDKLEKLEDEGVAGIYAVTFHFDASDLSDPKRASIALDVFYAHQGPECLDDFEIEVIDANDKSVDQDDTHEDYSYSDAGGVEKISDTPVRTSREMLKPPVSALDAALIEQLAAGLKVRMADGSVQDAFIVWEGGNDVAICKDVDSAMRVARAFRLAGSVAENIWVTRGPEFETVYNDPKRQGQSPSPGM